MDENERSCANCRWYYTWFGVCFNGDSEFVADCPDAPEDGSPGCFDTGCSEWEERGPDFKEVDPWT